MNKLVLHHRYRDGIAWDLSGNFNHGTSSEATAVSDGIHLSPAGQVWVRPSASLSNFLQLRARIRFTPIEMATSSVSLLELTFVDSTVRLFIARGNVYQKGVGWLGQLVGCFRRWSDPPADPTATPPIPEPTEQIILQSTGDFVRPNVQYDIEITHDGINLARLTSGGTTLDESLDAYPASTISSNGIRIGGIIPLPPLKTKGWGFKGTVHEVQLYKLDLKDSFDCVVDLTQVDGDAVSEWVDAVFKDKNVTSSTLGAALQKVFGACIEATQTVCGTNNATNNTLRTLAHQLSAAMMQGDFSSVGPIFQQANGVVKSALTPQKEADLQKKLLSAINGLPEPFRDLDRVAKFMKAINFKGVQ